LSIYRSLSPATTQLNSIRNCTTRSSHTTVNSCSLNLHIALYTGKLEEARKVLQDAVALLEKSHTASSDYCKAVVEDLKRSLASIRSQVEYKSHGRQYIKSKMQTHSVQRSNFVDDHDYYQNQSKASYRSLSKK
jgi:phosphoserine aminotransferase